MPVYDASQYAPPAPVARVEVRHLETGAVANADLLMDTGANATLLPRRAVEALGIRPLPDLKYELTGFDGSRSFADVVDTDMIFLNRTFRGRYLLIDSEHGILGRDVLNHATELFDGPKHFWSQSTQS